MKIYLRFNKDSFTKKGCKKPDEIELWFQADDEQISLGKTLNEDYERDFNGDLQKVSDFIRSTNRNTFTILFSGKWLDGTCYNNRSEQKIRKIPSKNE